MNKKKSLSKFSAFVKTVKGMLSPQKKDHLHEMMGHYRQIGISLEDFQKAYSKAIANGFDIDTPDAFGSTLLHIALRKDNGWPIAQFLIEQGADVFKKDSGESALSIIALKELDEGLDYWIEKGFPLQEPIRGIGGIESTPLACLVDRGNEKWVSEWLKQGLRLDENSPDHDILHSAWDDHFGRMTQNLIDHGASVHARKGPLQISVLYQAAESGCEQLVVQCIKNGADINYQCQEGETALHAAVSAGFHDIVAMLLQAGANPNMKTQTSKRSETPLHYLMCHNGLRDEDLIKIAQLLIEHGAHLFEKNKKGELPSDLAILMNKKKLHEWLVVQMEKKQIEAALGEIEVGKPDGSQQRVNRRL